jgi:hypothetical protein
MAPRHTFIPSTPKEPPSRLFRPLAGFHLSCVQHDVASVCDDLSTDLQHPALLLSHKPRIPRYDISRHNLRADLKGCKVLAGRLLVGCRRVGRLRNHTSFNDIVFNVETRQVEGANKTRQR